LDIQEERKMMCLLGYLIIGSIVAYGVFIMFVELSEEIKYIHTHSDATEEDSEDSE